MFTGLKKSIDKKYSYPGDDLGNQVLYIHVLYGFPKNLLQIVCKSMTKTKRIRESLYNIAI